MYEYMRGLYQQFFKEPDFPELRQEINEIHQALTEGKARPECCSLLKLGAFEYVYFCGVVFNRHGHSPLASFAADFRLAQGIISELSIETPTPSQRKNAGRGSSQNRGGMTDGKETSQWRGSIRERKDDRWEGGYTSGHDRRQENHLQERLRHDLG